ncbi:MAG: hypothetical protein NZ576_09500, partial [Bacteroidia bacterium]|nr:hypothetical protein [Bacteroidia bacterium]
MISLLLFCKVNGVQCQGQENNNTIALPDPPIVSEVTRCGEGPVTFTVRMGKNKGEGIRLYSTANKNAEPLNVALEPPFQLMTPDISTHTLFYIEAFNKQGSSKRVEVWAKVFPVPTLPSLPRSIVRCVGDTLRIALKPQSQIVYLWKGPEEFSHRGELLLRKLYSAKQSGIYSLQAISENGCSSNVAKVKVYIRDTPPVPEVTYYNDLGQTVPLCKDDNLNLYILNYWELPPGTQYTWYGPDGAIYKHPFPSISKIIPGPYYVVAKYGSCSSASEKIYVRFSDSMLQAPVAYNNSPLCEGSSFLELKASPIPGAVQYVWSGPHNFTATGTTLRLPAHQRFHGIWSVTAINAEGCASPEGTTEVKIFSKKLNLVLEPQSNSPVCEGQPLRLSAKQYPGVIYTWLGPNQLKYSSNTPYYQKN